MEFRDFEICTDLVSGHLILPTIVIFELVLLELLALLILGSKIVEQEEDERSCMTSPKSQAIPKEALQLIN